MVSRQERFGNLEFPERVLRFPADRSLGMLYLCAEGRFRDHQSETEVSEASGEVRVPMDASVKLKLSKSGAEDLTPLLGLGPDALQAIEMISGGYGDDRLAHLGGLVGLRHLEIGWGITNKGLAHLRSLPNLRGLDIYSDDVTDSGLAEIGRLSSLEELTIGHATITDAGVAFVVRE